MVRWQSLFDPVPAEEYLALIPYAPRELIDAYLLGDAPFIADDGVRFPVYSIPNVEGEVGSCIYFLAVRTGEGDSISGFRTEYKDLVAMGYTPIARDGGAELLLLRQDDGSLWHYAPTGRLSRREKLFRVADGFPEFLDRVSFVS